MPFNNIKSHFMSEEKKLTIASGTPYFLKTSPTMKRLK
jgi:hypothetical protein